MENIYNILSVTNLLDYQVKRYNAVHTWTFRRVPDGFISWRASWF